MKIAIVEDEVILSMALTLMLEEWGHLIVGTADNEEAALALVETERPDVVLMDIRLGRGDSGLAAARLIRAASDVPIIFCTAYADSPPIKAQVATIPSAHLIDKPVDEDQLEYLLRRLGERQRQRAVPLISPEPLQVASNAG